MKSFKTKITLIILPLLAISFVTNAEESCPVQKSQAVFLREGHVVSPTESWGPSTNPCIIFGADRIWTPKHRIDITVSFNIPVIIDLTYLDTLYGTLTGPETQTLLRSFRFVFVTEKKMEALYIKDAYLSMSRTIGADYAIYISDKVIKEGLLEKFWNDLLSGSLIRPAGCILDWPNTCPVP